MCAPGLCEYPAPLFKSTSVNNCELQTNGLRHKNAVAVVRLHAGMRPTFSDGVVVGVVIRKVERYEIKPTESEAEH